MQGIDMMRHGVTELHILDRYRNGGNCDVTGKNYPSNTLLGECVVKWEGVDTFSTYTVANPAMRALRRRARRVIEAGVLVKDNSKATLAGFCAGLHPHGMPVADDAKNRALVERLGLALPEHLQREIDDVRKTVNGGCLRSRDGKLQIDLANNVILMKGGVFKAKLPQSVIDALDNVLGLLDNPVARRKIGGQFFEDVLASVKEARKGVEA